MTTAVKVWIAGGLGLVLLSGMATLCLMGGCPQIPSASAVSALQKTALSERSQAFVYWPLSRGGQ